MGLCFWRPQLSRMAHSLRCPDVWGLFYFTYGNNVVFGSDNEQKELITCPSCFVGHKQRVSWFVEDFTNPPTIYQYGWLSDLSISWLLSNFLFWKTRYWQTVSLCFVPPSHFCQCPWIDLLWVQGWLHGCDLSSSAEPHSEGPCAGLNALLLPSRNS